MTLPDRTRVLPEPAPAAMMPLPRTIIASSWAGDSPSWLPTWVAWACEAALAASWTAASMTESGATELTTEEIGERLLRELRGLDEVAYVRFASVYRQFSSARQFMAELNKLLAQDDSEN